MAHGLGSIGATIGYNWGTLGEQLGDNGETVREQFRDKWGALGGQLGEQLSAKCGSKKHLRISVHNGLIIFINCELTIYNLSSAKLINEIGMVCGVSLNLASSAPQLNYVHEL